MNNLVTWSAPVGGAGTTTAVWHMAHAATATGEPVLIVDLNPSKALTRLAAVEDAPGFAAVLQGGMDIQAAIRKTSVDNLHILPAGNLNEMLIAESISQGNLVQVLGSLAEGPHPVFLDLPSQFPYLLSVAADLSDWVLLAVPCHLDALSRLADTLEPLAGKDRHKPSVGLVISRFAAWSASEFEQYRTLRRNLPASALWRTVIPHDEVFCRASAEGLPATALDPSSSGARAFFDLFGEWTARKAFQKANQDRRNDQGKQAQRTGSGANR